MSKKVKSMKGKKGTVGAPEKSVKFPAGNFTIARAVSMNAGVCELTIRNRIKAAVKSGVLAVGDVIPQPKKAVGRPKFTYHLTGKTATVKAKAPRKAKTVTVANVTNEPTVAPVTVPAPTVTPVVDTEVPVATVEPVETLTPVPLPS